MVAPTVVLGTASRPESAGRENYGHILGTGQRRRPPERSGSRLRRRSGAIRWVSRLGFEPRTH